MAMIFVSDVQEEVASLTSRWRLNDAVGAPFVADDIGGIALFTISAPIFSLPSLTKNDNVNTSVQGGSGGYFSELFVAPYTVPTGITLEGSSCADPNGNGFNLISIPGQASLQLSGLNVVFNVWIGTTLHTVTATGALKGWPQHLVGVYDVAAALATIYVDGKSAATLSLSGAVGTQVALATTATTSNSSQNLMALPSTTGMQINGSVTGANILANTTILAILSSTSIQISTTPTSSGSAQPIVVGMPVTIASPLNVSTTVAAAQDVAVYSAPLSAARVAQHSHAFRQLLLDPGHVRVYRQIVAAGASVPSKQHVVPGNSSLNPPS